MLTHLFFPSLSGVRVDRLWREGTAIHLTVRATRRFARCPLCQRRSKRGHSHYERTLAGLCPRSSVISSTPVRRFSRTPRPPSSGQDRPLLNSEPFQ